MTGGLIRRFVLIAALVSSAGCGFISGLFTDQKAQVEQAYGRFHQAVLAGDITATRKLVSGSMFADLNAADGADKFQLLTRAVPVRLTITGIDVSGGRATLHGTGDVDGAVATLTATLVKTGGDWTIADESWNISIRFDDGPAGAPSVADVPRPDADEYAKLHGQWKGTEVGTSNQWTFSFADGYVVVVTDGTQTYEGLAAFHAELGAGRSHTPGRLIALHAC